MSPDSNSRQRAKKPSQATIRTLNLAKTSARKLFHLPSQAEDALTIEASTSKVPSEILSEIFLQLGPFILPRRDNCKQLAVLTRVSKLWRETIISTPGLWCHYELDVRNRPPLWKLSPSIDQFAKLWLERSKAHSIDLRISGPAMENEPVPRDLLLAYFCEPHNLARVRTLRIGVSGPYRSQSFASQIVQGCRGSVTEVLMENCNPGAMTDAQISLKGEYPCLTRLDLRYSRMDEFKKFAAPGLKSLHISLYEMISTEHIRDTIEAIPSLYPNLTILSIVPDRMGHCIVKDQFRMLCYSLVISMEKFHSLTRLTINATFLRYQVASSVSRCPTLQALILAYSLSDPYPWSSGTPLPTNLVSNLLSTYPGLRLLELPREFGPTITFESLVEANSRDGCVQNSRLEVIQYAGIHHRNDVSYHTPKWKVDVEDGPLKRGPLVKLGTNRRDRPGDFFCSKTISWAQFVASVTAPTEEFETVSRVEEP